MKLILILYSLLFFGLFTQAAQDCLPVDWTYTLNVGNLDIDKDRLAGFCTEKTCVIGEDFIATKSHYDQDAAIIVKDSEMITRLPYKIDSLGLIMSYVNPDVYNWVESIEVDLNFLKKNVILKIDDAAIEKIAGFSGKGENIFYCGGEWKQLGYNCRCDNNKELCFECEGALPLTISMPEELMPYDLVVPKPTPVVTPTPEPPLQEENALAQEPIKKSPRYYYFAAILLIIIILTAVIYAKNKKIFAKKIF